MSDKWKAVDKIINNLKTNILCTNLVLQLAKRNTNWQHLRVITQQEHVF